MPTGWNDWTGGAANTTRVTGIAPQPYAVTIVGPAATNCGILQNIHGRISTGWHVLEADVTLVSGALTGAGVFLNADVGGGYAEYQIIFSTDVDTNGSVVGAGTVGQLYKFRKLVQTTVGSTYTQIFAAAHYSSLGSIAGANSIKFHRAAVRAASQAEIEARAATTALVTANANIATNSSAIATETSARAAADTTLTARANSLYKASQNLLKNSTFTNNGTDWTLGGSPAFAGDGDNKYISLASALYQSAHQVVAVVEGRRYSISGEIYRSTTGMSSRLYVQWLTAALAHISYGSVINHSSTGWLAVKADLEGTNADMIAPATAVWARIYVDNYQPSAYPAGESAMRRINFHGGDYALPWSEGPTEAAIAANTASIVTNAAAIATETSARASADTTLTASVGTLTSSVATNASAITAVDGKLSASYALTVDGNGRIASMKLLSNGATSSVKFTADTFQVFNGTTDEAPFEVSGGAVKIKSANVGTLNVGSGGVTIQSASSGARIVMANSVVEVYDSSNVLRVRMGVW